MSVEIQVLRGLLCDEKYLRKVMPFIKHEYFSREANIVFSLISNFATKYNKLPNLEALGVELELKKLNESDFDASVDILESISTSDDCAHEWLVDKTEEWIKERALHIALFKSVEIVDGDDKEHSPHHIPELLKDALNICFDPNVGHDYINSAEERHEYYTNPENKIEFGIKAFNDLTNGGVTKKSLTAYLAGTGIGKTVMMCSESAYHLINNRNVLYVTFEMAEELIAKRIDANLMNIDINKFETIEKDKFMGRMSRINEKTQGQLIVKEYPTGSAHAGHIRALLEELKMKKNFIPDIVYFDYLGIAASSRYRGGSENSYGYVKAIAEEFRGLAVEYDFAGFTGHQTNRSGYNTTDLDMTATADCLAPETEVICPDGKKQLKDVEVGDRVLGSDGFVTVSIVHHPKTKKVYKIKTKSGKTITCSADHVFPTEEGRISINSGLQKGHKLKTFEGF